jgi:hypothetical protein
MCVEFDWLIRWKTDFIGFFVRCEVGAKLNFGVSAFSSIIRHAQFEKSRWHDEVYPKSDLFTGRRPAAGWSSWVRKLVAKIPGAESRRYVQDAKPSALDDLA